MKQKNGAAPVRAIHADHIRVLNWDNQLRVLDAKGNNVPGIIGCDVAMRPGVPPLMRINLAAGNFDVDGLPAFGMLDPATNRFRPIKRVEFADGAPGPGVLDILRELERHTRHTPDTDLTGLRNMLTNCGTLAREAVALAEFDFVPPVHVPAPAATPPAPGGPGDATTPPATETPPSAIPSAEEPHG